jgi:hypothetical protein
MNTWKLIWLAVIAMATPVAAQTPPPVGDTPIAYSLYSLDQSIEAARKRASIDPAIFRGATILDLERIAQQLREHAVFLSADEQSIFAQAVQQDALVLLSAASAPDLNTAWLQLDNAYGNLALLQTTTAAGPSSRVLVNVSVFTVRGTNIDPGYSIRYHRIGNPSYIRDFPGVTTAAQPTTSDQLVPGHYTFIAQRGGHRVSHNRVVGGYQRTAQTLTLPVE